MSRLLSEVNIKDYRKIEFGRPFFILHKDPKKQDITVWRAQPFHSDNVGLEIFFHGENFWCNPPTDTNMEYNATKKIEKYGIAYLTNPDEYIEGYKKCAWNEASKYRQDYADKFFEQRQRNLSSNTKGGENDG